MLGELLGVGASRTGFVVNNSNAGISDLVYRNVDMNLGWGDGGANDFFALFGAQWLCLDDIDAPGSRIGRYRLRFGNQDAPWDKAWGVGVPLMARIAVRTGPQSIGAVETRPDRGDQVDFSSRKIHQLSKEPGVQVIEQFIPAGFNPGGDDVGVGLYLPDGFVEKAGQKLEVLGVVIERVDAGGERLRGTMVGYQGRGGWSMRDHLDLISPASRMALVEMTDADTVMVILGHNREPGGQGSVEGNLDALVGVWEQAYSMMGRARPRFVFVVPWAISGTDASEYLLEVERVMRARGAMHRRDLVVNYLPLHGYTRPDLYDPDRYRLDAARVHPGDIPTAVNLGQDLFEMLFEGRRE